MANERIAETVERLRDRAGSTGETTGRTYTEREVVLMQREAYARALRYSAGHTYAQSKRHLVRNLYPLPTVERPRVVRIRDRASVDREWRYVGGNLQSRTAGICSTTGREYDWVTGAQITPTPDAIGELAGLLARPTETVPDEETDGEEQDRR